MDAFLMLSPEDRELINELKAELAHSRKTIPTILLSNREAARIIGLHDSYISVLVKRKRLTKRTIGRSTGILLSDVLDYKTRREAGEPQLP